MTKTHELELVIGIDALGLISQENIEGAKIALGVKEDNKVLQAFCEMLTENVRKSIERFSNTGIIHGSIRGAQDQAPSPTYEEVESEDEELNDNKTYEMDADNKTYDMDADNKTYDMDADNKTYDDAPEAFQEQDAVPEVGQKEGVLISSIFEKIFKIKSEGNRIFSLSVKNDYNFETLYRELMLEKGQIEYSPDIEDDYVIQYVDEKGDNVIVGGKVNNV
ncbi:MAG: hypothetical protein EOM38_10005 [Bacilli bacterium]|nr:hypothetical protein [Bacilli bacterium]